TRGKCARETVTAPRDPLPLGACPMTPTRSKVSAATVALIVLAVLAAAPRLALGQGTSGSIVGYVMDQTGNPIKGVKISASSPTQIGGTQVGYTNDEGQFRVRQLFPGL